MRKTGQLAQDLGTWVGKNQQQYYCNQDTLQQTAASKGGRNKQIRHGKIQQV
jgi:hypothetical protein